MFDHNPRDIASTRLTHLQPLPNLDRTFNADFHIVVSSIGVSSGKVINQVDKWLKQFPPKIVTNFLHNRQVVMWAEIAPNYLGFFAVTQLTLANHPRKKQGFPDAALAGDKQDVSVIPIEHVAEGLLLCLAVHKITQPPLDLFIHPFFSLSVRAESSCLMPTMSPSSVRSTLPWLSTSIFCTRSPTASRDVTFRPAMSPALASLISIASATL